MAPADGGKGPVMLDLDVLLLGLVGAAFLVTGGALLRGPAVARARFLAARATRDREEALASSARAAEAIRVAEGETERVRSELLKLQQRATEQQRGAAEVEQLRSRLDQQATELKAALAELKVERELSQQLETQGDQTRAQLRSTMEQHKAAEARAADLEARLRDAEDKQKAAEGKLKELEGKLKEAESKQKAAPAPPPPPPPPDNAALEAAQNKITALERMLEGSRARARELQKELSALKGG